MSDYNKEKILGVQSVSGTPTVSRALPVKIVSGDDGSTGTGKIVLDWANISSKKDVRVLTENGQSVDYWFESFDASNETAVVHVYRDYLRDGSAQLKVVYGGGSTDYSSSKETVFDKESGLRGGWAMNETSGDALDLTGNNFNGNIENSPTRGINGAVDGAYDFGNSDSVAAPYDMGLSGDSEFTESIWWKGLNPGGALFSINYDDSPHRGVDFWVSGDNEVAVHIIHSWSDNALKAVTDETGADHIDPFDGDWHLITATYDGSKTADGISIYVDGQEQPQNNTVDNLTNNSITDPANPVRWTGRSDDNGDLSSSSSGSIDDVRIYREKLSSDTEVARYDASKQGPDFFSQRAAKKQGKMKLDKNGLLTT